MGKKITILWASLAFFGGYTYAADSYNPTNAQLTIPKVVVADGSNTDSTLLAKNVVITLGELISSGEAYPLESRTLTNKADMYDTATGYLLIPQVVVESTIYEDIVVTIKNVVSHSGGSETWHPASHSGAESLLPFDYYFAEDIPKVNKERFKISIEAASDYFGRYGRTEIYVVGSDEDAMERLIDQWCIARQSLNSSYESCRNDRNKNMFEGYRQKSLVDQYGAGINGRKDLGIHLLVSAYPGYFDEDDPAEFGWANVMHEYFHISQLAHAEGDMGPVWWVEGTAQFLDKWLTEKLQSEGKLPILTEPFDFIGHMSWTLRDARRWWAEGNRLELEGGPELFLWLGPWTTAYLLNSIDNYRALQDIFYPNIRELGFEGAFERTFNIPYNDFNEIFRQFMEKPIEEQLSILPGWAEYENKEQAISKASPN